MDAVTGSSARTSTRPSGSGATSSPCRPGPGTRTDNRGRRGEVCLALPGGRAVPIALSVVGRVYPPVEVTIDPDRVAAFARSLGADPADGVPPTYAVVYAWEATAHQIFGDPDAGIDLPNLLHTDQDFEWARQPRV